MDLIKRNQLLTAVEALKGVQLLAQLFVEQVEQEFVAREHREGPAALHPSELDDLLCELARLDIRAETTRNTLEASVHGTGPSRLEQLVADVPAAPPTVTIWSEAEGQKRADSSRRGDSYSEVSAAISDLLNGSPERFLVKPECLDALAELERTAPNFKAVIADLLQQADLSLKAGPAPVFDPVLLLGPPGVGKTHFAHRLAEALKSKAHLIPMGVLSHAGVLCGTDASWKGARMGQVTRALIESEFANPVIILDEVDKASFNGTNAAVPPASTALYSLLEPETAKAYLDEFFMLHFNAAHVTWVLTANDASCIPEPLLSRMRVYEIPAISADDMPPVIDAVYRAVLSRYHAEFFEPLPPETVEALTRLSPRDLRLMLADGVARANRSGRQVVLPEDVHGTSLRAVSRPIGFV